MKPINMTKPTKAYFLYVRIPASWKKEPGAVEAIQPVEEALAKVQRLSRVRTIEAWDIVKSLLKIERRLDIPKVRMNGIRVSIDLCAQNFPSAYNGRPESTQFEAEYKNGHWVLTDIYRAYTRRAGHEVYVRHTEASKAAIIQNHSDFCI